MANAKIDYGKRLKDGDIMYRDSKTDFSAETMETKATERCGTPPSVLFIREVPQTAQANRPMLWLSTRTRRDPVSEGAMSSGCRTRRNQAVTEPVLPPCRLEGKMQGAGGEEPSIIQPAVDPTSYTTSLPGKKCPWH